MPAWWKRKSRTHFSDEVLLSWLDGEASRADAAAIGDHLKLCWECRSRASDIDERIRSITRRLAEEPFPDSSEIASAKQGFLERKLAFERSLAPAPRLGTIRAAGGRFRWAVPGLAASAAAVAITLWLNPARPDAGQILTRAQQDEIRHSAADRVSRQEIHVEVAEVKPKPVSRAFRLEVWSDEGRGRAASRWQEANGPLRRAVWRPEAAREASDHSLIAWLDRDEAADLEVLFARWLESRSLKPVLLARDFATFAGRDGVSLTVERVRRPDGVALLLRAVRSFGGRRVEAILELEPAGNRPRIETVRLDSPKRSYEVRMTLRATDQVSRERVPRDVFEPDAPVAGSGKTAVATALPESTPDAPPADPLSIEVAVLHALHRQNLCMEGPIQVDFDQPGRVRVRGLALAGERRREVQASLALIARPLSVEIATGAVPGATPKSAGNPLRVETPQLAIQAQLERFAARRGASISEFTNTVTAQSETALVEAWALRRLLDRWSTDEVARMDRSTSERLKAMTQDHAAALARHLVELRHQVGPFLSDAFPAAVAQPYREFGPLSESDWKAAFLRIFDDVRGLDRIVQALFAGTGRTAAPAGAVVELSALLARSETALGDFQVLSARQFDRLSRQAAGAKAGGGVTP